jgi:hypothetical protein
LANQPSFPDNLRIANWFCWITLVACLILAWWPVPFDGYSERRIWILTGLLAVNPYFILFGCSMFSRCSLLSACWRPFSAARKHSNPAWVRWMIVAGVACGMRYLSRTAGIPLILSVPLWLMWKRQWRAGGDLRSRPWRRS